MIVQRDKTIINSDSLELAVAVNGFLVDGELKQKILDLHPNYEMIVDGGVLLDVIEVSAPPQQYIPTQEERIAALELAMLDVLGL